MCHHTVRHRVHSIPCSIIIIINKTKAAEGRIASALLLVYIHSLSACPPASDVLLRVLAGVDDTPTNQDSIVLILSPIPFV